MIERLAAVTIHVVRDRKGDPWQATTNRYEAEQMAVEFAGFTVTSHRVVLRVGWDVAIQPAALSNEADDEEEEVA